MMLWFVGKIVLRKLNRTIIIMRDDDVFRATSRCYYKYYILKILLFFRYSTVGLGFMAFFLGMPLQIYILKL